MLQQLSPYTKTWLVSAHFLKVKKYLPSPFYLINFPNQEQVIIQLQHL